MTYELATTKLDFNDAAPQRSFEVIPAGTIVKVSMWIKAGGHTDLSQGWADGWATRNPSTGAVYLNCEFTVLEGEYAKRKIWHLIGLHSEKGDEWRNMGKSFIKAILNGAHGFSEKDDSAKAQAARCINGYQELNGLEFNVLLDVEVNERDNKERNRIETVITKDHPYHGGTTAKNHPKKALNASANDLELWSK